MNREQFDTAKEILAKIVDLEKKSNDKSEYNTVKIMVSSNGVYYTEYSSIVGIEEADKIKQQIVDNSNNFKKSIEEQINKLNDEFSNL
jgi:hypothetical protein